MRNGRILTWCAVALLSACNGNSKQASVAKPAATLNKPAAGQSGLTPAEQTRGMVEAATIGKSTVPVNVKFDLGARPTVGQPLEVVLAVMPQIDAVAATLQVVGSDGLQLSPDTAPMEIRPAEPTSVYRESLKMTPTVEGVQLLSLSVSLKHDDITETRAFSVPIIVTGAQDAFRESTPAKH